MKLCFIIWNTGVGGKAGGRENGGETGWNTAGILKGDINCRYCLM